MQARMNNPILVVPEAMSTMMAFAKTLAATEKTGGPPAKTRHLVHLRASQINGCSVCVDMHAREARHGGDTEQRLYALAAWREAPYFTDAERAALALTEATTRLADREDPVSDEVWAEAARHYDEAGLAALVLDIAMINLWNRVNAATRQVAGSMG